MPIGLALIVCVLMSGWLWSLRDCAHWLSIDSLFACVRVDIEAYDILPVFDIDTFGVVPGLTESSLWGREFTTASHTYVHD